MRLDARTEAQSTVSTVQIQ